MKSFTVFSLAFVSIFYSCNATSIEENQQENKDTLIQITHENSTLDDSVQVKLAIEKLDNTNFIFQMDLKLFGETYIVSPLEKDYPYGPMTIKFESNDYFELVDSINEIPKSQPRNEHAWEATYHVIENETKLEQKIKLKSLENFEVSGNIFFVLEPICSAHNIHFTISNNENGLSVIQLDN